MIPATPTLVTQASAPVVVGGALTDTAILGDGVAPTGAITFRLFGPDDPGCATEVFASVVAVAGNGAYTSAPFTATTPGLYRWIAAYGGDGANAAVAGTCNDANETTTVIPATPTLVTQASAPVVVGGALTDTAILGDGVAPTGAITFRLFGPDDPGCATEVFASVVAVAGNGAYTSAPFTATTPGLYRWIAAYGGDGANAAVAGACNDANETTTVIPATPVLSTIASAPVVVGAQLTDTAILAHGVAPTGTMTFRLFGPDDAACNTEVFASAVAVTGNGAYTSAPFTATAPGLYRWIAAYGGDGANAAVAGACNDANETTTVIPATPTLVTVASAPVVVGAALTDTAILGDGVAPTGAITFRLFGPDDPGCATEVFASVVAVTGNGDYTSAPFTATAPGLYRWIAAYGGDGANAAVAGACNDANETTTVIPATPVLSTIASAPVVVGAQLTDTAILAHGVAPTGTMTFRLFGPDDATCNTEVFASTVAVTGNGAYTSAPFTATAPGLYRWIAAYGGDGANAAVTGACNDAGETTVVNPAPTTTTSTTSTTVAPTTTTSTTSTTVVPTTSTTVAPTTTTSTTTTSTTSTTVTPTTTTSTTTVSTTTSTTSAPTTTTVPTTTSTTSAPTITTTVPTLTTTATPTTNAVPATTTAPVPTTAAPATSTTAAPTTSTTAAPTTTTAVVQTTTTTLPAAPVDPGPQPSKPTLSASGTGSTAASPPGSVLDVDGKGYGDCAQVYFFLDRARIASHRPDGRGEIHVGVDIPGDLPAGKHTLTASCDTSGSPVEASTVVLVSDPELHRSVVITDIPKPSDIDLSPKSAGASFLFTILFLLLISFPGALLDSTVDENYDEIRRWFGLQPRAEKTARERSKSFRGIALVGFLLVGGIAGAFLDPSVGPSLTTAALAVGLATSLAVVFVCFGLPGIIYMRRHHQDRGRILLRPGALFLTAALVLISRVLHLEPGFLFGLIGGLAFGTELNARSSGRLAITTSFFTLGVGLAAWFLWVPVSAAAAQGDVTFWLVVADAALAGTFIAAVETLVIGLIPMRELDGGTIRTWKFLDWAAVYFVGAYAYVLIVLRPASSSGGDNNGAPWKALLIASSFAAISIAFWAYFRLRPSSREARDAEVDSSTTSEV